MSERARTFLAEWVDSNLYDCSGDDGAAAEAALVKDAHCLGIGEGEFTDEVGDLAVYLQQQMQSKSRVDRREMAERGTADV